MDQKDPEPRFWRARMYPRLECMDAQDLRISAHHCPVSGAESPSDGPSGLAPCGGSGVYRPFTPG